MAKIGFVFNGVPGHLNSSVAVIRALVDRGAAVHLFAVGRPIRDDIAAQLQGAELTQLDSGFPDPLERARAREASSFDADGYRSARRYEFENFDHTWIDRLEELLGGHGFDAFAIDAPLVPAMIAAHRLGAPFAAFSRSLTMVTPRSLGTRLMDDMEFRLEWRCRLAESHGLPANRDWTAFLSPYLNVLFQARALVAGDALPPNTVMVGPALRDAPSGVADGGFDWSWHDADRPLVYLSYGSEIPWQPAIYRAIIEALQPLGADLLLVAGDKAGEMARDGALPPWVRVTDYAPQLEILPRATVFVSHGGPNSVAEALAFGVPMLLTPLCNDQPLVADRIQRVGAGVVLDRDAATVDTWRGALASMLAADNPFRAAARGLSEPYRTADGAAAAATLLERLAEHRTPHDQWSPDG